jgi:hypothetical protein
MKKIKDHQEGTIVVDLQFHLEASEKLKLQLLDHLCKTGV